jgi:dCMP deaminase
MKKNAIIAFVPAIHSGYLNFFRKYPGSLYILGKDFIVDFPHIERDIRTPDIEDLKKIILALGIFDDVVELTRESIQQLPSDLNIIMPEDSVTRGVAEKYLKNREVKFDTVFLRWNRQISTIEHQILPDRIISEDDRDKLFIKMAEGEAKKSSDWWRQIGSVAVKEGEPFLFSYNENLTSSFTLDSQGDPRSDFDAGIRIDLVTTIHSEANLIATAAKQGVSLDGTSIYVTTFPCPGCARLIVKAGIKKVYYAQGYSLLDAEQILKAFDVKIVLVK